MSTRITKSGEAYSGLKAGADLSAKQYYCVMLEADGDANVATAQTAFLGILLNKPTSGLACEIGGPGYIGGAYAGGTFAPGDKLMVDTGDGMLVIATDDKVVVATALQTGADGSIVDVIVETPHLCADVSDEGVANA
jgi:hypothetical protein